MFVSIDSLLRNKHSCPVLHNKCCGYCSVLVTMSDLWINNFDIDFKSGRFSWSCLHNATWDKYSKARVTMNIYIILFVWTCNQPLFLFLFHVAADVASSNPGKKTSHFCSWLYTNYFPHFISVLSLKACLFHLWSFRYFLPLCKTRCLNLPNIMAIMTHGSFVLQDMWETFWCCYGKRNSAHFLFLFSSISLFSFYLLLSFWPWSASVHM